MAGLLAKLEQKMEEKMGPIVKKLDEVLIEHKKTNKLLAEILRKM